MTRFRARDRRRGVALLIVLGILTMALGVCYAMLRGQSTSSMIERNQGRLDDARSAALTGVSIALAKMHTTAWSGVGSSLTGNLNTGLSYRATFAAGDASLDSADADYADLPYRVTVQSVGTAVDPSNPSIASTHAVDVVVQLVPRAMAALPAKWSTIQNHTVFQWGTDPFTFEMPARIEGDVHAQGAFALAPSYPTQDSRPFKGHIDEIAVYNKALTDSEILAIQSAAATPPQNAQDVVAGYGPIAYWRCDEAAGAATAADSAGANPGAYVGAKSGDANKPFWGAGSSAQFDGFNDHIRCGRPDVATSAFTVLCWFRADSFPSGDQHLVCKALGPSDADQYWMLGTTIKSGARRLKFGLRTSHGWKDVTANSGDLFAGVWTFAAATYDGSKLRVYKDGTMESLIGHSGTITANANAFLCIGDTPPGSPRTQLLRDERAMQLARETDMRPVTGTWRAPVGAIDAETLTFLRDDLGAGSATISADTSAPVTIPGGVGSYQLFSGGPIYKIPDPGGSIENATLAADPSTNPLGFRRHQGNVDIKDSVTGTGTLFLESPGDLGFKGTGTNWSSVLLPAIDGESNRRRYPAFIVAGSVVVEKSSVAAQVSGAVVAGNRFEAKDRTDVSPGITINGRVVSASFRFGKRKGTPTNANDWRSYAQSFLLQTTLPYFPGWLASNPDIDVAPLWTIRPDPAGHVDQWPDLTQPVFVPRTGDGGLRWRVVSWREGTGP